jgi:hypothetical protein
LEPYSASSARTRASRISSSFISACASSICLMCKDSKLTVTLVCALSYRARPLKQRGLRCEPELHLCPLCSTHTLSAGPQGCKAGRPCNALPKSVLKGTHCRVVGKSLLLGCLSAFGSTKALEIFSIFYVNVLRCIRPKSVYVNDYDLRLPRKIILSIKVVCCNL